MLTSAAHTIQPRKETQPETVPAKAKSKATSRGSEFGQFMGQFLGAVEQNTQQAAPHAVGAQPAPQPAAALSAALPENTAVLPGVNDPDAATELSIDALGSEDNAGLADANGNDDALMRIAHDKTAADDADGQKTARQPGDPPSPEKPSLHELLAKQGHSGTAAEKSKTNEATDSSSNNTLLTEKDFSTVMHQESSGVQNVQAQISGATITHRTHEGTAAAPLRALNAADVLDPAPSIVKDGNRLAVKFEQDGLGKLDIDLRLNKGVINAQIQVVDDSTKTLIENNMQQIVDSLLKAGLTIGGFSVSLKNGGRQNGTPEEQYGYGTERASGAAEKTGNSAQRAAANGLVSIFI